MALPLYLRSAETDRASRQSRRHPVSSSGAYRLSSVVSHLSSQSVFKGFFQLFSSVRRGAICVESKFFQSKLLCGTQTSHLGSVCTNVL